MFLKVGLRNVQIKHNKQNTIQNFNPAIVNSILSKTFFWWQDCGFGSALNFTTIGCEVSACKIVLNLFAYNYIKCFIV